MMNDNFTVVVSEQVLPTVAIERARCHQVDVSQAPAYIAGTCGGQDLSERIKDGDVLVSWFAGIGSLEQRCHEMRM